MNLKFYVKEKFSIHVTFLLDIVGVAACFYLYCNYLTMNNKQSIIITSTFITMFKRHRFKGTGFKGTHSWV